MFNNVHCKVLFALSETSVSTFFQNSAVEVPYGIIKAEIHGIIKIYNVPSKIRTMQSQVEN